MSQDFKEKTLSSQSVFSGKLLHVYRDDVALPDGSTGIREWIDHPGASAIVPVHGDGRVTLVKQYRYAAKQLFLEVPAGKADTFGEDPLVTARRELVEETGWDATSWVYLGKSYPGIGFSNELIHFYLAESLYHADAEAHASEEDEFLEVITLPWNEAMRLARDGALMDMKTALALRWADEYFLRKRNRQ